MLMAGRNRSQVLVIYLLGGCCRGSRQGSCSIPLREVRGFGGNYGVGTDRVRRADSSCIRSHSVIGLRWTAVEAYQRNVQIDGPSVTRDTGERFLQRWVLQTITSDIQKQKDEETGVDVIKDDRYTLHEVQLESKARSRRQPMEC